MTRARTLATTLAALLAAVLGFGALATTFGTTSALWQSQVTLDGITVIPGKTEPDGPIVIVPEDGHQDVIQLRPQPPAYPWAEISYTVTLSLVDVDLPVMFQMAREWAPAVGPGANDLAENQRFFQFHDSEQQQRHYLNPGWMDRIVITDDPNPGYWPPEWGAAAEAIRVVPGTTEVKVDVWLYVGLNWNTPDHLSVDGGTLAARITTVSGDPIYTVSVPLPRLWGVTPPPGWVTTRGVSAELGVLSARQGEAALGPGVDEPDQPPTPEPSQDVLPRPEALPSADSLPEPGPPVEAVPLPDAVRPEAPEVTDSAPPAPVAPEPGESEPAPANTAEVSIRRSDPQGDRLALPAPGAPPARVAHEITLDIANLRLPARLQVDRAWAGGSGAIDQLGEQTGGLVLHDPLVGQMDWDQPSQTVTLVPEGPSDPPQGAVVVPAGTTEVTLTAWSDLSSVGDTADFRYAGGTVTAALLPMDSDAPITTASAELPEVFREAPVVPEPVPEPDPEPPAPTPAVESRTQPSAAVGRRAPNRDPDRENEGTS